MVGTDGSGEVPMISASRVGVALGGHLRLCAAKHLSAPIVSSLLWE